MNLKHFISKHTLQSLWRFNIRKLSTHAKLHRNTPFAIVVFDSSCIPSSHSHSSIFRNPMSKNPIWVSTRNFHSVEEAEQSDSEEGEDREMTEFLSRFVWIMRGKLCQVYPDCDKQTLDGMLLFLVEKVVSEIDRGGCMEHMLGASEATLSGYFSEDLWKTVWEASNMVLEEMQKAKKKEKMKSYLQNEEVKQMYSFALEIGVRGDLLRELWYKWAREKMERVEFDEMLYRIRDEARARRAAQEEAKAGGGYGSVLAEEKPRVISLPKRRGKIRFKIYGLDLSGQQWAKVADRIHETEKELWPQVPRMISGKCKLVTERIFSLKEEDDPSPLLAEWVELLQPRRVDWATLIDRLKEKNSGLYFKVAELVLSMESFQSNINDYSKLIDAHAKENRLEDAERIFKKMSENGIFPDIVTYNVLVHMYSKAGNLDRAKEAFENLRRQGFQPDMKIYHAMIMSYVTANQPNLGEALIREMEEGGLKPTEDIYMALLQSFSQRGDVGGAHRISTTMQFAGLQPSSNSCALLIEAYGRAGDPDEARNNFDYMRRVGHMPDDKCVANMISAYEKKNLLDKALALLLGLEKDGIEAGVATYTVLVDWFSKLQLDDEAEHILGKIGQMGEAPPFDVHVSLCEMYSRAGVERKALRSLGLLEAKKEHLGQEQFERIINGLISGGFVQEARRIHGVMEAQGFAASERLKVALMSSQAFGRNWPANY